MDNGGGGGEGCNRLASKHSSIFKISSLSIDPPLVLLPIGIKFVLVRISCGQFLMHLSHITLNPWTIQSSWRRVPF